MIIEYLNKTGKHDYFMMYDYILNVCHIIH